MSCRWPAVIHGIFCTGSYLLSSADKCLEAHSINQSIRIYIDAWTYSRFGCCGVVRRFLFALDLYTPIADAMILDSDKAIMTYIAGVIIEYVESEKQIM